MKIPKNLQIPSHKKMTPEMIEEGRKLLLMRYSEKWVAKQLGVSRHTLRMHCVKGYREIYKKRYKNYAYQKVHSSKETRARNSLRRYHILSDLNPEEMKVYRKKRKDAMGKEYFREYMKKYRNPNL